VSPASASDSAQKADALSCKLMKIQPIPLIWRCQAAKDGTVADHKEVKPSLQ
jgi:hypothetical protein